MKKTMNYRIAISFCAFFLIVLPVFAQAGTNPGDSFYTDAKRWELMGLTDTLPAFKPYPAFVIESILQDIKSSGNMAEKVIAESYEADLFSKVINPYMETIDTALFSDGYSSFNRYGLQGNILLSKGSSFSYWGAGIMTNSLDPYAPYGSGLFADYVPDTESFGNWLSMVETNCVFALGTRNLYVQTGISRTGYGENVADGLVFSPQGYHAPYILFNAQNDRLRYTQSLFRLLPTNGFGKIASSTDEKLMAFHAVEYNPFPHLYLSYFESMYFGHRTELSYLVPSLFITSQAFSYFSDNLLMGVSASWRTNSLSLYTDLYIDDLSIGNIVKLNPEARFTRSQIVGLNYIPNHMPFSFITFDYTLVTPWMYAHHDGNGQAGTVNYQNCTNYGHNTGTQLEPNSHRLALKTALSLPQIPGLSADLGFTFIQHGNISESLETKEALSLLQNKGTTGYRTDGSIHQNGINGENKYLNSYLNKFQFLEQDTIKSVLQLSSNLQYTVTATDTFRTTVGLSYTFEYIRNDGIERDIFVSYGPDANADTVKNDLRNWRNGIIPESFNNYVTLSCKIVF